MATARKIALIAALIVVFAAMPRSCHADLVYGAWTGVESYSVENIFNGNVVFYASGMVAPTTLKMTDDTASGLVTMDISPGDGLAEGLTAGYGAPFGPASAFGSAGNGNYFLTYASILPGGIIDTTGGSAAVDITDVTPYFPGGVQLQFYQFQTLAVPEPPSVAQAVSAILMLVVFAWMRAFRPRPRASLP